MSMRPARRSEVALATTGIALAVIVLLKLAVYLAMAALR